MSFILHLNFLFLLFVKHILFIRWQDFTCGGLLYITNDRGRQFEFLLWRKFDKHLGNNLVHTKSDHPKSSKIADHFLC